jgi:hypothetical protein
LGALHEDRINQPCTTLMNALILTANHACRSVRGRVVATRGISN